MSIFKIIVQSSYTILTICIGCISYIYITKGIGGDTFIGVCSFAITCVFSIMVYQLGLWFFREALPELGKVSFPLSLFSLEKEEFSTLLPSNEACKEVPSIIESEHEQLMNAMRVYAREQICPLLQETQVPALMQILEDYAKGEMPGTPLEFSLDERNDLTITDVFHFGWNMWFVYRTMNRHTTCRFLKKAFPTILENTNVNTIYAKMTKDWGLFSIRLFDKRKSPMENLMS